MNFIPSYLFMCVMMCLLCGYPETDIRLVRFKFSVSVPITCYSKCLFFFSSMYDLLVDG